MLFEEVYEEYKIYAQNRHKKQGFITVTQAFYLHVLPYFKNRELISINKQDIIKWENDIFIKDFKNKYNSLIYYSFSDFIIFCVLIDYLKENIVLQIPKFKKKIEKKEHHVYTLKEFRKFRKYLDDYIIKQYFNFMYFYGTRPSEAMALRFSDLEKNYIHINHSIHRKGKRELDTPKNQSSIRTLKLNSLERFRIWRLKRMYFKKYYDRNFDYFIFGGKKPLSPTTIDRYKLKACRKANMNPITQHEFRHSYATRMILKKKPINLVSKSMGHSNISTTLDIYTH